jgi:urate oxidase
MTVKVIKKTHTYWYNYYQECEFKVLYETRTRYCVGEIDDIKFFIEKEDCEIVKEEK